jgi:hypothetical protein
VTLTGDGLEKVPVGKRATFLIEPEGMVGPPDVKVTGPLKKSVHSSIQIPSENKFMVEYVPIDVGKGNWIRLNLNIYFQGILTWVIHA